MLCEKCGKMNGVNAVNCAFCGAPMPAKSGCGGFGDILDYEAMSNAQASATSAAPAGVDLVEMRKISRNMETLAAENKKVTMLSVGAIIIAALSVLFSLCLVMCSGDPEPETPQEPANAVLERLESDDEYRKKVLEAAAGKSEKEKSDSTKAEVDMDGFMEVLSWTTETTEDGVQGQSVSE